MISVPYSLELNDLLVFGKGFTGPEFVQMVKDQYEQLHADSATTGRVLTALWRRRRRTRAPPQRCQIIDSSMGWLSASTDYV